MMHPQGSQGLWVFSFAGKRVCGVYLSLGCHRRFNIEMAKCLKYTKGNGSVSMLKDPHILSIISGVLAFVVLLLIFILRSNKRLDEVLKALGLKKRLFMLSKRVTDKTDGTMFFWELEADHLFILFPFKSTVGFEVKRKKELGILEENFGLVNTGHPDFDEHFAVICNDQMFGVQFFQNLEIINLLQNLLNQWVKSIELNGKVLRTCISIKTKADPSLLTNHIAYLIKLKKTLETELSQVQTLVTKVSVFPVYLLYAIPICLCILELVANIWMEHTKGVDFSPLVYPKLIAVALFLWGPLALFYLFVAYKITRRYSGSYIKFTIASCLLPFWFFFSSLLIQSINGFFDKSPPRREIYAVIGQSPGKSSYTLVLSRPGEKEKEGRLNRFLRLIDPVSFRLRVKQEEYLRVRPNKTMVEIKVREGLLGIKWVESYTIFEISKDKPKGESKDKSMKDCHLSAYNLYKNRELDSAVLAYTKCLEENGEDPLIYYNRGVAYREKSNYLEAYNDFEKAISLKPDMLQAYKNIDWILAKKKEWGKIVEWWNRYISLRPDDPEGYYERGGAYYRMGAMKEAMEDATKACKLGKKEACEWVQKAKG